MINPSSSVDHEIRLDDITARLRWYNENMSWFRMSYDEGNLNPCFLKVILDRYEPMLTQKLIPLGNQKVILADESKKKDYEQARELVINSILQLEEMIEYESKLSKTAASIQ